MARNQAMRRAAKAAKRKAIVAIKRTHDLAESTPAGQVRAGAALPILDCLISDGLFESGIGVIILTRGSSRGYQYVSTFMVDSFCLGVKAAYFRTMERHDAEYLLESTRRSDPVSPIAPAEARRLLHDLVAWSRLNGFPPPKEYALSEQLFGDVIPAETDNTHRFGYEGNVLYVPGPSETPAEIRRRLRTVRARVGEEAASRSLIALARALIDETGADLDDEEC